MNTEASRLVHDIAASGAMVDVACGACGRLSKIDPRSLVGSYGQRRLSEVPLRCGFCGAAGGKVTLRFASRLFMDRRGEPLRVRTLYDGGQELRLLCTCCRPSHEIRFATARQVEEQLGCINPLVSEACQRLVCSVSLKNGMVGVAASPRTEAQMRLPLLHRHRAR
ncbi:hypothetical protein [Reyranella sp. CPCC 100927]|uniref:hypothetical protein n=1 Tax=Reyranella sp. CPCC 100927 TaxID=2599616 RepID=UPI0011B5EBBD|nr:hypothetical protein [Reyranella sp. CPCC 100927]TWT11612.1 hypothetical protein FQU96_14130 [Reyranella sp. CPCC 100927]